MPPRNKSPKSGKTLGVASIFHRVRKLDISGGHFTVVNPDTEDVEVDVDPDPGSVKPHHDIYYDQLLLQKKGSPMYIPGPDMSLPKDYRRQGIGIGDIGVLYCAEGFNFLFNIFLPATHPINEGRVPNDFVPLDGSKLLRREVKVQALEKKQCFTSSSVQKLSSLDPSISIFKTSVTEGAILVLPDGGISEDLFARKSINTYLANNAKLWYRFVRDERELEVKDGAIRLVIGLDKVSSWGIATSVGSVGGSVRLEFKSVRQEDQAASQMYAWNCVGRAQGRVGPEEGTMTGLREDSDRPFLRNQCVFVRTVNFDMSGQSWAASDFHQTRLDEPFSGSPPPGPSRDRPADPSNDQYDNAGSDAGPSQFPHGNVQHHSMKRAAGMHPSDTVNKMLLDMHPGAQMAITEDADWISVLDSTKDVEFPESDELYARLLGTHEICEEDGVVSFKRDGKKSWPGVSRKLVGFMRTFWANVTHRNLSQVVVCIGLNGSGKGQLIDSLTRTGWAHDGLRPVGHPVRSVRAQIPGEDGNFILVDTPGFDDYSTIVNVLEDVADWLKRNHGNDIKIFILYLHDITTNRLTVPPPMHLLTRLCGNNAARQFVLVTTHWDQVELDKGTAREAELKVSFRPLLIRGATTARFDKTTESAWKFIKPLLSQ